MAIDLRRYGLLRAGLVLCGLVSCVAGASARPAAASAVPAPVTRSSSASAASSGGATPPVARVLREESTDVLFKTDSVESLPESEETVRWVRDYLVEHPEVTILRIESHWDNKGSWDHNVKLAGERTMAIARRLVAAGVDCRRLETAVRYPDPPPNDPLEPRPNRRRISFIVTNARAFEQATIAGMSGGDPCGP